ncbi:biopolymer transporter ExbD [candidate division KSB1 bacterium]|nr:biopolymer transporter ExbD [candidate division KSB1 bacterium]NIR72661.1 biopolymer transporter ExbD [candidate division KSB1 bacterium]NIS23691.1 biopolymer transporter ExbD [candidate division KSB1 bacterium]NIT70611.1 biopolymer transporter ExbD [candidate division KSB1 bacterium]NIU24339.1 biopolymer transporter ExbD [candidate division KSB1 bacterium]
MKSGRYTSLSEINVTSLVDVTLVLLIVFMIAAPLLRSGMNVNLPQAAAKEIDPGEAVIITVDKEGQVFWNKENISVQVLRERLEKRQASGRMKPVLLQGDKDVPYGKIIEVMDVIKQLAVGKLGLILKPRQK